MPVDRFYIPDDFIEGDERRLEGTEFHHLLNVMRMKQGETIEVVNGQGKLAVAKIEKIEKKSAHIIVQTVHTSLKQTCEIIIAQAIPRINRLDDIVEKGTELGMTQLWLFPGELSERKELSEHQLERLKNISISALKQCGRLHLPQIMVKPSLAQWKDKLENAFFGDLNPDAPHLLSVLPRNQNLFFFTGPESGFSEKEIESLSKMGCTGVKLHQNILRTDTATFVALAFLSTGS